MKKICDQQRALIAQMRGNPKTESQISGLIVTVGMFEKHLDYFY